MKSYLIRGTSSNEFESFRVEAEDYTEAATRASHELNGPGTRGLRATGNPNMSGVFQGYRSIKGDGENGNGGNFHVSEES